MPKQRVTEQSTTVETYDDISPTIPQPVPFKEPSGELRENINFNFSLTKWLRSLLLGQLPARKPKK